MGETLDRKLIASNGELEMGGLRSKVYGANYVPSYACNSLEIWAKYDGGVVERELGYAVELGLAGVRTFIHSEPFLERPDEKYKECVRDTEFMRLHHWELLRAVREEVVRYGHRGDIGISKCRECHVSREGFCNRCHNSVNLYPDCFGCHYYPEPSEVAEGGEFVVNSEPKSSQVEAKQGE